MSRVVPTRLPANLASGVDRLVRSGRYRNRSDAMKEATRLLLSSGDVPSGLAMSLAAFRVASLIISWNTPGVETVTLYGSVARGEPTSQSDIDLLVIVGRGETWRVRRRLYDLIYPVIAGLGVDVSLMVVTSANWREMVREKDPLALVILREGKTLWGRLAQRA